MTNNAINTQATILDRALSTTRSAITVDAAQFLLSIHLDPKDERRANELAEKARLGDLSDDEQAEIEEYRRVGRVIEMLKLRAKAALKQAG